MEAQRRKEGLLVRAAQALELPAEVAGEPKAELTGSSRLRMENHRGILAYGPEEILISGGRLVFRVRGKNLELMAMTAAELLIEGEIASVGLE